MNGALDETIADEAAKAGIRESMTKLADWMRNKSGELPPTGDVLQRSANLVLTLPG